MSILDLFQGIGTMFAQSPQIAIARVVLIFLGLMLGVLCDASTLLDATVVKLLILGSIYSGLCSRREYLRRYHNGNPDRYLYYVT